MKFLAVVVAALLPAFDVNGELGKVGLFARNASGSTTFENFYGQGLN